MLKNRERQILAAIADRAIVPGPQMDLRPGDVDLVDGVEEFLVGAPWIVRLGVRMLLRLFDLLALVTVFGFHRFTGLTPEGQDRYMRRWHESRIYEARMSFRMLLILIYLPFYGDERVQARLSRGDDKSLGPAS